MGDRESKMFEIARSLIGKFTERKDYAKALKHIEHIMPKLKDRACVCELLELKAHCHSAANDNKGAFSSLLECFTGNEYDFIYAKSGYIFGVELYKGGLLDKALESFNEALGKSEEGQLKEDIRAFVTRLEEEKKSAEIKRAKQEKEALKVGKELIVEEDKKKKNETKRRGKERKERNKHDEKVVKAVEEIVEEAAGATSSLEVKKDDGALTPDVLEWQPKEFSAQYKVILNSKPGMYCYVGALECGGTKLDKSFVQASQHQISECSELIALCRRHDSLLIVENLVASPDDVAYFLVTEAVRPVDEYFASIFKELELKDEPAGMWWHYHISEKFLTIFRDVAKGLLFLFEKTPYVVGDLSFNTFVTIGGRGRILPTLDPKKKEKDDILELVKLMKLVIHPIDTDLLPMELRRFFDFVPKNLKVPPSFLVDHPYFWTVGERIDFASKFKNLAKGDHMIRNGIQYNLNFGGAFKDWDARLKGVYQSIYHKPRDANSTLPRYRQEIDIGRYFSAVYSHINEREYKSQRNGKKKTEEEIERDLVGFFPEFYVAIFEALCNWVLHNELYAEHLKLVSSSYFRKDQP